MSRILVPSRPNGFATSTPPGSPQPIADHIRSRLSRESVRIFNGFFLQGLAELYEAVRTDLRLEPHLAVLNPMLAISGRVQVANQSEFLMEFCYYVSQTCAKLSEQIRDLNPTW